MQLPEVLWQSGENYRPAEEAGRWCWSRKVGTLAEWQAADVGCGNLGAVVVDFDGTVIQPDGSQVLLSGFAPELWESIRRRHRAGKIGMRQFLIEGAEGLPCDRERLTRYVLDNTSLARGFREFLEYCRSVGLEVVLCTDGFGFYVEDVLKWYGLPRLEVFRNQTTFDQSVRLEFPHAHPTCRLCGTCKRQVVEGLRRRAGPVAFVGDGRNDVYGAAASDVVFGKGALSEVARGLGIKVIEWTDFLDVVQHLQRGVQLRRWGNACPV